MYDKLSIWEDGSVHLNCRSIQYFPQKGGKGGKGGRD